MENTTETIKRYPASVIQQQFWSVQQLDPESSAHNIPSVFQLKGTLCIDSFKKSLLELINTHEILRTTFSIESGTLMQVVNSEAALDIPIIHIDKSTLSDEKELWENYIRKEVTRPFDLMRGPLVRATLFQIESDTYIFVLVFHHIVTDLRSKDIFAKEFSERYNQIINGISPSHVEPVIHYGDYADRHANWLNTSDCSKMLSYWAEKLVESDGQTDLPFDYPRPTVQSLKGSAVPFSISKQETDVLKKISKSHNVTIFLTLLATYFLAIYRYSNRENIVVGVPFTNRRDEKTKNTIGCFVSILPISVTFSDDMCFNDLLKQIRKSMLEAHRNQETPFKIILDMLKLKKEIAYNPVFQTGFTFEHPMTLELESVETTTIPMHCGGSQLDMFPVMWESEDGIKGHIEYCTDIFDKQTIDRFIGHYKVLLQEVADNTPNPVSKWNLLTEDEKKLIVNEWNNTAKVYPGENGIHRFFEKQVTKTPDAVALKHNGVSITYDELNRKSNKLAHWLIEQGVVPDTPVGIFMERSIEMVVSIYGIVKAGGAYVPIDPEYPEDRINYMLDNTDVSLIMTQNIIVSSFPLTKQTVLCLDTEWAHIDKYNHVNPELQTTLDNFAYIIYTSGSTGRPKGVINSHKGIINRILWMQDEYQLNENDVVLQKTPYSFDVSVWEFFWPLLFGSTLVIAPAGAHKDPLDLIRIINDNQVTTLHFVPSMLNAFLEYPDVNTCQSVKRVICSGEALSGPLQKKFFQKMDASELHNLYGPTEAAVDVTYWRCQRDDDRPSVPIGKPVSNTQMYILDKFMQLVPVGVPGELYIGGIQVAKGYLNKPELTNERFIKDPFSNNPESRLYKTGDLVKYLPDGNIDYIGRMDFQIKIRGLRIELGEIEAVMEEHPFVSQAIVISKVYSSIDQKLIAYYIDEKSGDNTKQWIELSDDIKKHIAQKLPEYMVPSVIVKLDEIPLTQSGKVDRNALPEPVIKSSETSVEYKAPENETEIELAGIWKKVLNIEEVGINDNFFDIGGNSLLSTYLASIIKEKLDIDIPIVKFFQYPTINLLSSYIDQDTNSSRIPAETKNRAELRKAALRRVKQRKRK